MMVPVMTRITAEVDASCNQRPVNRDNGDERAIGNESADLILLAVRDACHFDFFASLLLRRLRNGEARVESFG
jgi:hypothetical protein